MYNPNAQALYAIHGFVLRYTRKFSDDKRLINGLSKSVNKAVTTTLTAQKLSFCDITQIHHLIQIFAQIRVNGPVVWVSLKCERFSFWLKATTVVYFKHRHFSVIIVYLFICIFVWLFVRVYVCTL